MEKKRFAALVLALMFCLGICLVPGRSLAESPGVPPAGEYVLFGAEMYGYLIDAEEADMHSVLTLREDGTGEMSFDSTTNELEAWAAQEGTLTLHASDGTDLEGTFEGGIILLDFGDSDRLYYAQEGTDLSGYELLSREEFLKRYSADQAAGLDSLLYAFSSTLDAETGVHLNYEVHRDYLNADQAYDVHGKTGVFFSLCTTRVSGFESSSATFYQDGKTYSLKPDAGTGILAAETSSGLLDNNILMLDNLYSAIQGNARQKEYTVETREVGGESFTVEVYPAASEYAYERAFYFSADGQLRYCLESSPKAVSIGDSFYTVHAIDTEVDESLFDISGYAIQG